MKMKIETLRVDTFKSGEQEGEWRTFELPDGAIVLRSTLHWPGDHKYMVIEYAVAA